MKLRELKPGSYFTIKEIPWPKDNQVWVKGQYDRGTKSFSCNPFDDYNNEKLIKADKEVYTDFTF